MVYLKCSLVKEDKTMQNDVVIHGCLLYAVFQTSKIIFLMRSDKCLCYNKEFILFYYKLYNKVGRSHAHACMIGDAFPFN